MRKFTEQQIKKFQQTIYSYYRNHCRHLPWRTTRDPYKIVISEIMLQQTQAERVIPHFQRWLTIFPGFPILARASLKKILTAWQGLGYNRRALHLKRLAEMVITEYKGKLPQNVDELDTLPGIGPHTAGAIAAFAFNQPTVFIETNIRTVYIYFFFPKNKQVPDAQLLPLIEQTLDRANPRRWYNALMDYGVMLKKRFKNPSRQSAHHVQQSKFEGSNRQVRGMIIKLLTQKNKVDPQMFYTEIDRDTKIIRKNLIQLEKEGFIKKRSNNFSLA